MVAADTQELGAARRCDGEAMNDGCPPLDAALRRTTASGPRGFTTLVVDTGRDPLVGATAAGPAGGEVLGMLALAVHGRLLVDRLSMMIFT